MGNIYVHFLQMFDYCAHNLRQLMKTAKKMSKNVGKFGHIHTQMIDILQRLTKLPIDLLDIVLAYDGKRCRYSRKLGKMIAQINHKLDRITKLHVQIYDQYNKFKQRYYDMDQTAWVFMVYQSCNFQYYIRLIETNAMSTNFVLGYHEFIFLINLSWEFVQLTPNKIVFVGHLSKDGTVIRPRTADNLYHHAQYKYLVRVQL